MHLMNQLSRVSAAALVGTTLMLVSMSSFGLGFGRPISQATLGESLTLTVPLRTEASEVVSEDCIGADVLFGDERLSPSSVQVSLVSAASGEQAVRITTSRLIHEPIITVRVKAGCVASMTRQFVVLADPPAVMVPAATAATASNPTPAAKSTPTSASTATATSTSKSTTAASSVQPRAAWAPRPKASAVAGTEPRRVTRTGAPPASAANVEPPSQPRLMLDPAGIDAVVVPELRLSTTMDASAQAGQGHEEVLARREAAAALWRAMNAQPDEVVRDQQRVQELEQRLAQLNAESQKASDAVGTMQARLKQLESQGAHSVWLYVLGAVALAALLAAVYFHRQWRRLHAGREAAWWQSQVEESVAPEVAPEAAADLSRLAAESVRRTEPEGLAAAAVAPVLPRAGSFADDKVDITTSSSMVAAEPLPVAASTVAPVAEMNRAVTVEELIDLEQQADFFAVLGQDDAAIDLLENHVDGATAASPLPYLKLLEIYQRLGKRGDYERVQQAFNQRFNAYAPAWESDLQQGHRLDDYPGVVERLQALWSSPTRAMDVLERSLTRPDEQAETFDLPAYRELLFLYAVARDLAERELHQPSVDLLVSTGAAFDSEAQALQDDDSVTPLMATRPIKAQPDARPDFTLDLHLDDLDAGASSPFTSRPLPAAADHEHIDLPDVPVGGHRR